MTQYIARYRSTVYESSTWPDFLIYIHFYVLYVHVWINVDMIFIIENYSNLFGWSFWSFNSKPWPQIPCGVLIMVQVWPCVISVESVCSVSDWAARNVRWPTCHINYRVVEFFFVHICSLDNYSKQLCCLVLWADLHYIFWVISQICVWHFT